MSLAKSASTSASSTGRIECNLYDVIRALEDLHADVGFTGNSYLTNGYVYSPIHRFFDDDGMRR
ncbi:putative transcription initiation factor TFIID subunit 8 [Helianthus annuus]|nr:putative transcription initiation factor TFIID subunit 8 [Helianthus annuus]